MKKVLIVVDMQNDFVDGSLGSKEATAIVKGAAERIRRFEGQIIVTYDTHQKNYPETREGRYLPVAHCIEGTEGWQLNADIEAALAGKEVIRLSKPTFGSVEMVDLFRNFCEEQGSEQGEGIEAELLGLCTDICVVSNAMLLKAYFPEMEINVDADCCAGVTPESHAAALLTMKSCQINVIE